MNGDSIERLPQEVERHQDGESCILESASTFAHRVLEEIVALAGTTACKPVQLVRLKKWAQEQNCWFDNRSQFGDFIDRGSENEVYLSPNSMVSTQRMMANTTQMDDMIFLMPLMEMC